MRRLNKFLALSLALVLALGLAACGDSFESAMVRAAKEMQEVESVHVDMALDMGFGLDVLGETGNVDVSVDMGMDTAGDLTSGELTMTLFSIPVTVTYISQKNGETYDFYVSMDGGSTWEAQTGLSEADLSSGNGAAFCSGAGDMVGFYLEFASSFGEAVDEAAGGTDCRRYDGSFPGDKLTEALSLSGGSDFANIPEGTVLPDAPISIWLDKSSGLPRRISLDMTDAMGQYMTGILSESGVSGDLVSVTSVIVTVDLSEFNAVTPMTPPAV